MKETLREQIEGMRNKIIAKIHLLELRIAKYKGEDDFENAIKCNIKLQTLINVKEELSRILNK